ncbi:MAG TPA: hypothetical protein VGB38_05715 [bacterium]
MNHKDRPCKPDHPARNGMDQSPMKTIAKPSEQFFDFSILGDQIRLLIAPCRDLHGMTLRGLIGQRGRDGKTTLSGEPPGFSVIASY